LARDVLADRAPNLGREGPIALASERCKLLSSRALAAERYESFRFVHEQRRYTLLRMCKRDDRRIAYPLVRAVLARVDGESADERPVLDAGRSSF
jgi:hypothetical protein